MPPSDFSSALELQFRELQARVLVEHEAAVKVRMQELELQNRSLREHLKQLRARYSQLSSSPLEVQNRSLREQVKQLQAAAQCKDAQFREDRASSGGSFTWKMNEEDPDCDSFKDPEEPPEEAKEELVEGAKARAAASVSYRQEEPEVEAPPTQAGVAEVASAWQSASPVLRASDPGGLDEETPMAFKRSPDMQPSQGDIASMHDPLQAVDGVQLPEAAVATAGSDGGPAPQTGPRDINKGQKPIQDGVLLEHTVFMWQPEGAKTGTLVAVAPLTEPPPPPRASVPSLGAAAAADQVDHQGARQAITPRPRTKTAETGKTKPEDQPPWVEGNDDKTRAGSTTRRTNSQEPDRPPNKFWNIGEHESGAASRMQPYMGPSRYPTTASSMQSFVAGMVPHHDVPTFHF